MLTKIKKQNSKILAIGLFCLVAALGAYQLWHHRHYKIPIALGPGVTRVGALSEYLPSLQGTAADTFVFYLEGKDKGGVALLLGGSHPNEPAGILASVVYIENAIVEKGTVIVIPFLNRSASCYTRPGDGYPLFFSIPTPWGERTFRMGNREASPLDQWPDPDIYVHYPEKQLLSFIDARNINRAWPGRPNGFLMEQVAYAVMELIRKNNVNVVIDFHEAETLYPVTNCIVAPDKSARIATLAALWVKPKEGFDCHVEPSPINFRGLSHREIGDYSDALPFLLEAPIPFLDQPTGPKTEELLLFGRDPFLLALAKRGRLFVPYDENGWSMDRRVGQHMSVSLEIFNQFSKAFPEKIISVTNVPKYADLIKNGIGTYLLNPQKASKIVYQ
ncbi:MAG: hypothetical protein QXT77_06305 [Candidatus Methanomethylicaceae archaeon]